MGSFKGDPLTWKSLQGEKVDNDPVDQDRVKAALHYGKRCGVTHFQTSHQKATPVFSAACFSPLC